MSDAERIAELEQDLNDVKRLNADLYHAVQVRASDNHALEQELQFTRRVRDQHWADYLAVSKKYEMLLKMTDGATPDLAAENQILRDELKRKSEELNAIEEIRQRYYDVLTKIVDAVETLGWSDVD